MGQANQINSTAPLAIIQSFLKDGLPGQFVLLTNEQVDILALAIDQAYQTPAQPNQRSKEIAAKMLKIRRSQIKDDQANCTQHRKSNKNLLKVISDSLMDWWGSSLSRLSGLMPASNQPIQQSFKVEKLKRQMQNSGSYLQDFSDSQQSYLLLSTDAANSQDKNKME